MEFVLTQSEHSVSNCLTDNELNAMDPLHRSFCSLPTIPSSLKLATKLSQLTPLPNPLRTPLQSTSTHQIIYIISLISFSASASSPILFWAIVLTCAMQFQIFLYKIYMSRDQTISQAFMIKDCNCPWEPEVLFIL